MDLTNIVTLVTEIGVLLGVAIPVVRWARRIVDAQRCQLRHEMLQTYYHHDKERSIRQYEYENFVHLYEAYKALGGNSFMDKIYKEVQSWQVVT